MVGENQVPKSTRAMVLQRQHTHTTTFLKEKNKQVVVTPELALDKTIFQIDLPSREKDSVLAFFLPSTHFWPLRRMEEE